LNAISWQNYLPVSSVQERRSESCTNDCVVRQFRQTTQATHKLETVGGRHREESHPSPGHPGHPCSPHRLRNHQERRPSGRIVDRLPGRARDGRHEQRGTRQGPRGGAHRHGGLRRGTGQAGRRLHGQVLRARPRPDPLQEAHRAHPPGGAFGLHAQRGGCDPGPGPGHAHRQAAPRLDGHHRSGDGEHLAQDRRELPRSDPLPGPGRREAELLHHDRREGALLQLIHFINR
jgi:hypothetical protein